MTHNFKKQHDFVIKTVAHVFIGRTACPELPGLSVIRAVLHRCLTCSHSLASYGSNLFQRFREVSLENMQSQSFFSLFPISVVSPWILASYSLSLVINVHYYLSAMGKGLC